MNIYLELTREFNQGRLRAIVTSGQAVVLHRLAIMSKDGDWILREDQEALGHVLGVLARRGARCRFGAPLDLRWLRGGWSSHFEFSDAGFRVRTDFFTRPPRVTAEQLAHLWREQEGKTPPVVDLKTLAEMKKTDREKDYAVIGEIARQMSSARDQLAYSRSARDLIDLAAGNPELMRELASSRPILKLIASGRERLEEALDAERRGMMRANEARLDAFRAASKGWYAVWAGLSKDLEKLDFLRAHELMLQRAQGVLPFEAAGGAPG